MMHIELLLMKRCLIRKLSSNRIADIAQLVEQLICNQWVGGSNPSIGTNGAIAQLGERLVCNEEVVGSIPSGSTKIRRMM